MTLRQTFLTTLVISPLAPWLPTPAAQATDPAWAELDDWEAIHAVRGANCHVAHHVRDDALVACLGLGAGGRPRARSGLGR